jgi:hypothetical protein
MFSKIIAWFSKRWPEQYVVTMLEYKQLREELGQYNVAIQAVTELNNRLVKLESQVGKLNDANGFISNSKGNFKLER